MSHFSVIVIGGNIEAQLAPFHEFECTGTLDEYVVSLDITDETRADHLREAPETPFAEFCAEWRGDPCLNSGEEPDLAGAHKWGWIEVKDGEVVKVIRRTNPNKRWDYWTVGGAWTGYFPLRNGSVTDSCKWGDVDIEKARRTAESKARAQFAPWGRAIAEHGRALAWSACIDLQRGDLGKAREFYDAQPAIAAHRATAPRMMVCPVEEMGFDEEEYVRISRKRALVPFAVVKDGKWHERGKMGWFACVSNETDREKWADHVATLFDGLPPDTLVTVVNCHV